MDHGNDIDENQILYQTLIRNDDEDDDDNMDHYHDNNDVHDENIDATIQTDNDV